MKDSGITRKIDELGRVVIPIELRRALDISEKDFIQIYTEEDKIILKRHSKSCLFCTNNTEDELIEYKGKPICKSCVEGMPKV